MTTKTMGTAGVKGPGARRRKAVDLDRRELVSESAPVSGDLPRVLEPALEGVDLVEWAAANRARIEALLLEHRALLFRGFDVGSVETFQAFVAASSSGEMLQYRDRSTPRYAVSGNVYISTIYPPDQSIRQHNEGTYWMAWPRKIYFCCLQAPETGGETPICDVRKVYERIDPEVRERFESKGVMYVRNYHPGIGLTWQEAYQTSDESEVEAYLRSNRIDFEWTDAHELRTRQIRPAVRRHPETGEKLWFNHGAFFHVSSQEPGVREALLASYGEEGLPYNTYYGDGSPIDDAAVADVRAAYEAETVKFPWREGDVLFMDNMSVSHGREPYRGERKIVVAMVDRETGENAAA